MNGWIKQYIYNIYIYITYIYIYIYIYTIHGKNNQCFNKNISTTAFITSCV